MFSRYKHGAKSRKSNTDRQQRALIRKISASFSCSYAVGEKSYGVFLCPVFLVLLKKMYELG